MIRFISMLILVQLLNGCGNKNDTAFKNGIPGTYISSYEGNYSSGVDTIQIKQKEAAPGNTYAIIKCNAFRRKRNGVVTGAVMYKKSSWLGVYDENTKTVVIPRNGRVLIFEPRQNQMTIGITVYKKQSML